MSTATSFREDRFSVGSRVSWGAILAGVAVAFALYFLLNLLGLAIGLSLTDDAGRTTLGTGAAIWAIVSVMLALFLGGWVTSRFTVGEDRVESLLNGAILWGVSFIILLWVVSIGLSTGYGVLVQATSGQINAAGGPALPAPGMGHEVRETATEAAWWAFAGTLLSMLAAIGGSVLGAQTGFHGGRRLETTTATRTPVAS